MRPTKTRRERVIKNRRSRLHIAQAAFESLEARRLLSNSVTAYVNLLDGPHSASSSNDAAISVTAQGGVGDAEATAGGLTLSAEGTGGGGLIYGANGSASASWSFTINGAPKGTQIPLNFVYSVSGTAFANSMANGTFNLASGSYTYSVTLGNSSQNGEEYYQRQNGQLLQQVIRDVDTSRSIGGTFTGGGTLQAQIQAGGSAGGPSASGGANAILEVAGVASSSQSTYPNMSVTFDKGATLPVVSSLSLFPSLKNDGPESDAPGKEQLGDPIDIGSGNVFRYDEDFATAGADPLSFGRYYNTYYDISEGPTALGARWRSTYDRSLRIDSPTSITAERATGQRVRFSLLSGVWKSDTDLDYTLTQSGPNWILTCPDDSTESYAANGAGNLLVATIHSRDGYAQSLQYNSDHQLASVTDSFGRMLALTYQSGRLSTLTTPDGLVYSYGYIGGTGAASGELASVTYPTTPQTSRTYQYNSGGLLAYVLNEDGNAEASFTYDTQYRATNVYTGGDTQANSITVTYNDTDGSRSVVDASGLKTLFTFVFLHGMPKLTSATRQPSSGVNTTSSLTYDINGYLARSTDWNGNVTTYVNDAHGQPTTITEAAGTSIAQTTTISYLSNYHLPIEIVAPGLTTDDSYDASGNLLTLTQTDTTAQTVPYATKGQKHTWTYTYDAYGHVLTADGPRTDVNDSTTYTYTATGYLASVTDPLGHSTQVTSYNLRGLPLTLSDANGVITTLSYDPRGRLLTRSVATAAGNAATSFVYDSAGLVTSITQPDHSVLYYAYDGSNRLTKVSDPAGEAIFYTLDGRGNVVRQNIENSSGAIVETQSQVFNDLDQLLQSIDGTGTQTTNYGYDANGNALSITDGRSFTTAQAFDALNRLVRTVDPLNGTTQQSYNSQGEIASVTTPRNLKTTYVYDGFGQVIEVISPDTGTTIYTLDPAGNRVSEKDARGVVTNRTFDALNRVISESYPASPSEIITYSYDSTAGGNFGVGRLTGYTDQTGSTSLAYDALGDITKSVETVGGIAFTTAYKYNLAGNVTQIVYPSKLTVNYSYDTQGRVNGVSASNYSATPMPAVSLASKITYMPFGPLASLTFGNGLVMTRSFNLDYEVTGVTTKSTKATVQSLSYGYDADGDISSILDALAPSENQTFAYDALNRVTAATGPYSSISYTYDADSNRLTSTQGGVTQTYHYSASSDQLTSIAGSITRSLAYTANGNIATDSESGQPATYTYSNADRLSQATIAGGSTATYLYNALGERLTTTVGSTVTRFTYDQAGQLLAESNGKTGATAVQHIWLGGLPLGQIESNGTIEYVHADQTNTPQKMTNSAQSLVWSRDQQPFGQTSTITGTASTNLRAPGQYADATSGLNYNMFRDYDPSLGRYVEADPLGLAAGVSLYGYVGQNPTNAIDFLGLCPNAYNGPPDLPLDDPTDPILSFLIQIALARGGSRTASIARMEEDAAIAEEGAGLDNALKTAHSPSSVPESSPTIRPTDIAGKTPAEIDALAREKGLIPKGNDPMTGRGSYNDPVTGEQRVLSHPNANPPHAHVNDPSGGRLDINGNPVAPESPGAHLPLGGQP